MTNQRANHVIQSGPFQGKTVGEKRRIKRSQRTTTPNPAPLPPVQRRVGRRRRPRGPLQVYRPRTAPDAVRVLEGIVNDMAGMAIKPKEAVAFFNSIPGLTRAGRLYLLSLTHPNNEELRSFSGIPDSMPDELNPYVTIDDSQIITWDPTVFSVAPPEDVSVYNIHAFFPPIPEIQCIYFLSYVTLGTLQQSRVVVMRNPAFRTVTTHTVSAGNVLKTFPTFRDVGYAAHRRAGSGRTLIPICSALNNQGNIVAGQLPDLITWSDVDGAFTGPATLIGGTGYNFSSEITPTEEMQVFRHATMTLPSSTSLTQLDKKCMDGQYMAGTYLPLVPSEPIDVLKKKETIYSGASWGAITRSDTGVVVANTQFVSANSFLTINQMGPDNLLVDMEFAPGSALLQQITNPMVFYTPVYESGPAGSPVVRTPNYLHPSVSEPADMLTGFCYASGLSVQGGGIVSTASLKVRATDYNELFPVNTAPDVAVYRQEHPLRDQEALNIASHIVQVMAHALPASDNAFNGILGKIWNVIMKWVKPAAQVASALPIPYVQPAAAVLAGGIDTVNTLAEATQI